jgi:hypothetical protein
LEVSVRRAIWLGLLAIGLVGCAVLPEEAEDSPTAPSRRGLSVQVPYNLISTDAGQAAGSPFLVAMPTPTPAPDASPTPVPGTCPGLGITIDAHCAGSTPNCGINGSSKDPHVKRGAKVWLDASYYVEAPRNKVHDGDECYPGPISHWEAVDGVYCREPFANGHSMTCGPFEEKGEFYFEACGAGLCEPITVTVR